MFQMVGNKLVMIVRFYHLEVVDRNIESYYITYQAFFSFLGRMHGSMQNHARHRMTSLGKSKGGVYLMFAFQFSTYISLGF